MNKIKKIIFAGILGLFTVLVSCEEEKVENPSLTINEGDVSASHSTVVVGTTVTYTDNSTKAVSRTWNFPGGSPSESDEKVVEVTYLTSGSYTTTVQLNFEDGSGKIERLPIDVNENPVAAFSSNVTTALERETITFTDESTGDPDSWLWTFEGGEPATSTEQNPTVVWNNQGTYAVTLEVTRSIDGGTGALVEEGYMTINDADVIVAGFSSDVQTIGEGGMVTFTNNTTGATSYSWTFEGGTPATSTEENPVITYNSPGTYDVTLVASNSENSQEVVETDYITVSVSTLICEEATNLVSCGDHNGGETDALRWYSFPLTDINTSYNDRLSVSNEQASTGANSIKFTFNDGQGTAVALYEVAFVVETEGDYTFEMDVYGDNLTTGTDFVLEPFMADRSGNQAATLDYRGWSRKAAGEWHTVSTTKTLPPGTYYVGARIYRPGFNNTVDLDYYFDNFKVTRQ